MARIDASVATQVGDSSRPRQTVHDQNAQVKQAQSQDAGKAAPDTRAPSSEELRAAAARLQQVVEAASGRQLNFSFNSRFGELVAVIQDQKTGETISQIPSKDLLKLRAQIDDLVGMVVNKKA